MSIALPQLPFTQVRLRANGEPVEDEDGLPQGIVGRLYAEGREAQALKKGFGNFEPRCVAAGASLRWHSTPCPSDSCAGRTAAGG